MDLHEIIQNQSSTILLVKASDLKEFANSLTSKKEVIPLQTHTNEENELLTQPEACKYLKKSRQTLVSWRKKGHIKSYRISGRIYFLKQELIEALQSA